MSAKNRVVLLCDDETMIADLLSKLLELEDYKSLIAYNGADAVKLLIQNKIDVEVAVVDYHLPDCDGPRLIKMLHEIKPGLPIIMLSGDVGLTLEKVNEMGAVAYCDKVGDTDRLIEIVNSLLVNR